MNDKDLLYNTCPHCGGRLDQSQTWPFWEMWNEEWQRQMACFSFRADDPKFGETFGIKTDRFYNRREVPKPLPLIAWEQKNPEPKIKLNEYILKLAQKVVALEEEIARLKQINVSVR